MPQKLAGMRIDPPVSDPVAATAKPAATALAEPPLDPPVYLDRSHGLRDVPKMSIVPMANSVVFVLPMRGIPASASRRTCVASWSGT